jgi:hypothetical protein
MKWDRFLPPARPSPDEVEHYRQLALAHTAEAGRGWALLGSTPEIRSLAARHGRQLTAIDSDPEVFDALASLVEPSCTAQLVRSDWLELEPEPSWDVVFGDGALNMLPPGSHEPLLQRVHAMLAPGGVALMRVHLATPPRFGHAEQVFAWHRTRPEGGPVFSRTRTDLDMLWLEPDTLRISFPDYHRRIRRLFRRGAITQDEFDAYESVLEVNTIDLHYTTRPTFEEMARAYFELESVSTGADYFGASNHPIYALRKSRLRRRGR